MPAQGRRIGRGRPNRPIVYTPSTKYAPNADPIGKTGCKLWLTDETASDGSTATSWTDISGVGNTVANASATVTHETSEINGLPVKRFPGGSQGWLRKDPASGITALPYTVAVVWRPATVSAAGWRCVVNLGDLTASASTEIAISPTNKLEVYQGAGQACSSVSAIAAGQVCIHVITCDSSGNVLVYKNGNVDDTSGAVAQSGVDYTPFGIQLGAFRTGISETLDGDLGEVVVYDSVVSSTERGDLFTYLGRWVSSGTNFTQTVTDPVGISDSRTQALDAAQSATDAVGLTDSRTQVLTASQAATDPVGLTDSVAYDKSVLVAVTDPVGLTDSRTQVLDSTRSQTDPLGLTDAAAQAAAYAQAATDPVGLADGPTSSAVSVTLTDPVGIADSTSQTSSGAGTATFTDPVGLTDSRTQAADYNQTLTDAVGLVDAEAEQLDKAFTDPVGLTDSATQILAAAQTVTDPEGLADSQAQQTDSVRAQTDAVGITDSQSVFKGLDVTITDPVGLADTAADVQSYVFTLTDPVGISDSTSQQFSGVTSLTITDPVGLADSVTRDLARSLTDAEGITDSRVQSQGWDAQVTDPVGLSDSASDTQTYVLALTDAVGLHDLASYVLGDRIAIDPIGITDTVSYLKVDVSPRWIEGTSAVSGIVEGGLVGAGIVEGSASL